MPFLELPLKEAIVPLRKVSFVVLRDLNHQLSAVLHLNDLLNSLDKDKYKILLVKPPTYEGMKV
jgi:hypothetical protein